MASRGSPSARTGWAELCMVPDRKPRMRLLDDADLAPCLVNILTTAGYEVVDVPGMTTAADRAIFDRTLGDERIARTVDSDAPTLLTISGASMSRSFRAEASRR
jgi:hypothetical protein